MSFRYKSEYTYTFSESQELKRKYRKWVLFTEITGTLYFFLLPVVFGKGFYLLYLYFYYHILPQRGIFFPQHWGFFCIPGFFFMLSIRIYVVEWPMKLIHGKNYKLFEDYYNTLRKFDHHSAGVATSKSFIFLFLLSFLFISDSTLIASKDDFTVKKFYKMTTDTYAYTSIIKITYCICFGDNKGTLQYYPHYKIIMKDYATFSTNWYFGTADQAKPFIDLVVNTGVPFDSLEVDKDNYVIR
jgi:hypothetical protein